MPRIREKFIHTTSGVTKHLPAAFWQKISGQKLIFPFYHLVSDNKVPHVNQLYPIKSVSQFTRDIDFLLARFNPISYSDLEEYVRRDSLPEKPSFLLSFDDGLREFHDVAAPILLAKGVPAICFLNSGFIDNKDLMYRYKGSLLCNTLFENPKLVGLLPENFPESVDRSDFTEYLFCSRPARLRDTQAVCDRRKQHLSVCICTSYGFGYRHRRIARLV